MVKKNFEDIFILFEVIHERDGRTDRHQVTAYTARLCIRIVRGKKKLLFYSNM